MFRCGSVSSDGEPLRPRKGSRLAADTAVRVIKDIYGWRTGKRGAHRIAPLPHTSHIALVSARDRSPVSPLWVPR